MNIQLTRQTKFNSQKSSGRNSLYVSIFVYPCQHSILHACHFPSHQNLTSPPPTTTCVIKCTIGPPSPPPNHFSPFASLEVARVMGARWYTANAAATDPLISLPLFRPEECVISKAKMSAIMTEVKSKTAYCRMIGCARVCGVVN